MDDEPKVVDRIPPNYERTLLAGSTYPLTVESSEAPEHFYVYRSKHGVVSRDGMHHIARDVDSDAGFSFAHANKNIVPERTRYNLTSVNVGDGGFRALAQSTADPHRMSSMTICAAGWRPSKGP